MIWSDIKGLEGLYSVSSEGEVYSHKTNRILKQGMTTNGYKFVILRSDGQSINCRIHRLVAEAFINNPQNKKTVNHINSNRTDNNIKNLEWCTHSENTKHGREYGSAKYCYIERPVVATNIETKEVMLFKNRTLACAFFGRSRGWLSNKIKQKNNQKIYYKGWCLE